MQAFASTAYIGLGANLPWQGHAPEETVRLAAATLAELGSLVAVSRLWRTAPVGPVADQPEFTNAVAVVETTLDPEEFLAGLCRLETRFGRERSGAAKGPRTLDLDLLLMEDAHGAPILRATPALTLPHPEMHRRRFVLGPLAEVAPDLRHPGSGKTVAALLASIDGQPAEQMLPRQ